MNVQQTVAELLSKRDTLSSNECAVQIEKITKRLEEIRARDRDISADTNTAGEFIGATRKQVAETGQPQELLAFDKEVELLEAESVSLFAQRDVLRKRQKTAINEEAPGLAKIAIAKLPAALKSTETATRSLAKSTAILQDIMTEIRTARRTAVDAGIKAPVVKPDDFDRLAALLGWDYSEPPFINESNFRNARADRRAELTGWMPEQSSEPKMPWEHVERRRQFKARDKRKAYVDQSNIPGVAGK